jgi:DNA adenine methylase
LARHESRFVAHVQRAGPGLEYRFLARLRADLGKKFARTRVVENEVGWRLPEKDLVATVEGSVRAAMYMAIRARYNKARLADSWGPWRAADFLFLREFAYAAMFRFNASDEFNVPYGGKTYNRKPFVRKVESLFDPLLRRRLETTTWRSSDFSSFLDEAELSEADFVFVDPPYDSEFSVYDNHAFGSGDQVRLRDHLEAVSARVMVVIKDTPMIRELYGAGHWQISEAPKTYRWTIKSRNDRAATHLTITNY